LHHGHSHTDPAEGLPELGVGLLGGGPVLQCYGKSKRYGIGATPLCRSRFVEVTAKWGPGVRQKGYNA